MDDDDDCLLSFFRGGGGREDARASAVFGRAFKITKRVESLWLPSERERAKKRTCKWGRGAAGPPISLIRARVMRSLLLPIC